MSLTDPMDAEQAELIRAVLTAINELEVPYDQAVDPGAVERYLDEHPETALLSVVHSETPSGTFNDCSVIGPMARSRGVLTLVTCAKARAILNGRTYVSCEDVDAVAQPVLRHRIITNFNAESQKVTPDMIVERLMRAIPKPTAKRSWFRNSLNSFSSSSSRRSVSARYSSKARLPLPDR